MILINSVLVLLVCSSLCFAQQKPGKKNNTPVVLWHGMGDDCCNPDSMGRVQELLKVKLPPGTFIYSIQVGDTVDEDHKAGFFGKIDDQVDHVCEELSNIPELADGFNAIGFSQGGLFLRAYVERCNKPPINRLVTFGSPHGGVSDVPNCMNKKDFSCKLMRSMVRNGVYSNYIQNRIIQAQYYSDPNDVQGYLEKNIFLPYLNNELSQKNQRYKENMSSLNKFIMIRFSQDVMIKPGYTAWFWVDTKEGELVPLQNRTLYKEDWLGLKSLNEQGRLEFLVCPGQHMRVSDEYLDTQVIQPYLIEEQRDTEINQEQLAPANIKKEENEMALLRMIKQAN